MLALFDAQLGEPCLEISDLFCLYSFVLLLVGGGGFSEEEARGGRAPGGSLWGRGGVGLNIFFFGAEMPTKFGLARQKFCLAR